MTKPCIEVGCPRYAAGGPRCTEHQRVWDRARNARPQRLAYRDPSYRSYVVTGQVCALRIEGVCTYWATTRDHIIPLAAGGSSDPSNLQPACRACNSSKSCGP